MLPFQSVFTLWALMEFSRKRVETLKVGIQVVGA